MNFLSVEKTWRFYKKTMMICGAFANKHRPLSKGLGKTFYFTLQGVY